MTSLRRIATLPLLLLAACGPKPMADSQGSQPALAVNQVGDADVAKTTESAESADPSGAFKGAVAAVGTRKLYVDHIETLMLFADEQLEAEVIIANWAAAVGFEVIDPKLVRRTLDAAAIGKNPLSGEMCGPPLERGWGIRRWLPELGAAGNFEAAIYCNPDCTLQLRLQLDRQGTEFYAAAFDPSKPWREELHSTLRRLRDNGGHGKHGHLNNPVAVAGTKRSSELGDWLLDEADRRVAPDALVAKATSCGANAGTTYLLVEKTEQGAAQCERGNAPGMISPNGPAIADCLCDTLALNEATPRSLWTVPAPAEVPAIETTRSGLGLRASIWMPGLYGDEPWTEGMFFPQCDDYNRCESLAECFVERSAPLDSLRLGVTVQFDSAGAATGAAIADFEQALLPKEHACVVKRLQALRIPCPDTPSASRKAKLDLRIEAAEAP